MEITKKIQKALDKAAKAGLTDLAINETYTKEKDVIKAIKNATKAYKSAIKASSSNDPTFALAMASLASTTDKNTVKTVQSAIKTYKKALKASGSTEYAQEKANDIADLIDMNYQTALKAALKSTLKDVNANIKTMKAAIKTIYKTNLSNEEKEEYLDLIAESANSTNTKVINQLTKQLRKDKVSVEDATAVIEAVKEKNLNKSDIKLIVSYIKKNNIQAAISRIEGLDKEDKDDTPNEDGSNNNITPPTPSFSITESGSAQNKIIMFENASGTLSVTLNQDNTLSFSDATTTQTTSAQLNQILEIQLSNNLTLQGNATALHTSKITGTGTVDITSAAGDQTLEILTTGANKIQAGQGADQIKLGAGSNTLIINSGDTNLDTLDIITSFNLATDKLQLSGGTQLLTADPQAPINITSGIISNVNNDAFDTLEEKLDYLAHEVFLEMGETTAAAAYYDGTDTYIFQSDGLENHTPNDLIIKLAGIDATNNLTDILI